MFLIYRLVCYWGVSAFKSALMKRFKHFRCSPLFEVENIDLREYFGVEIVTMSFLERAK